MKDRIVLEFDTKFFKKEHVILAANDYIHLCWILVDGSDEKIYAVLIPKEEMDVEKLKDEFYNYVLSMVKDV
ncbi:MAG: HxsD-like protein [Candidatus Aenigmatarchaeota archaeon]